MGNQKETQKNPQYKYASTREKYCFGIGAIGKDLPFCNLVGSFLMLYFTDTLYLAPAFCWCAVSGGKNYGMRLMIP